MNKKVSQKPSKRERVRKKLLRSANQVPFLLTKYIQTTGVQNNQMSVKVEIEFYLITFMHYNTM